jgi:hypothetical protein
VMAAASFAFRSAKCCAFFRGAKDDHPLVRVLTRSHCPSTTR